MEIKVIRATETWQQAGAYFVRIAGMAKQYGITLRQEFDEHDTPDTKYVVLTDGDFPIATCRFFETDGETVKIGRVVVLPEYREKGLGRQLIGEAEKWISELGYSHITVDSRDVAVGFYKKLGYAEADGTVFHGDTFDCVKMVKDL